MKDATESRRLAKREREKARKLAEGPSKTDHLEKARNHEADAHANDWRDSNLKPPN